METLNELWSWLGDNPWVAGLIVVYVVANVAPRRHPDQDAGPTKILWLLLDRLSWLTYESMPGRFKWLLTGSKRVDRDVDTERPEPPDPEDT